MTEAYRDAWISCSDEAIRIRGYYFPWGTKTIPYGSIRSVRRVRPGPLTGQFRLWGTASPTVWTSLDPHRMRKTEGLLLDVGRRIRPYVTPDDAAAVVAVLSRHAVTVAAPDGTADGTV